MPEIGRFASADTIVPNPRNPQAFNRYSYVLNRPLIRVDPSGHDDRCIVFGPDACESSTSPLPDPPFEPEETFDPDDLEPSDELIDMLVGFEDFRPTLYNDSEGNCTIGIGHKVHDGACTFDPSKEESEAPYIRVKPNGEIIGLVNLTEEEARELLIEDLEEFVGYVRFYITEEITQAQFDALLSFVYNVGPGNFANSGVPDYVNNGDLEQARDAIEVYGNAQWETSPGLEVRRELEGILFFDGIYPAEGDF